MLRYVRDVGDNAVVLDIISVTKRNKLFAIFDSVTDHSSAVRVCRKYACVEKTGLQEKYIYIKNLVFLNFNNCVDSLNGTAGITGQVVIHISGTRALVAIPQQQSCHIDAMDLL